MTDRPLDNSVNTGHIGISEMSYSNKYLATVIAKAVRESGGTCNVANWDLILAQEVVWALRNIGALK